MSVRQTSAGFPVEVPTWSTLNGKPSTFPPETHTHAGLATLLGNITIAETALITITAGARRVTVTTPAGYGVTAGQNLIVFPVSVPSGLYATHDVIATGPNTISVGISAPLLAVGASYSITCRLVRINT